MKPSNLNEINKAFTAQAAGFESEKLHLSKQEYLKYTVKMTAPRKTDSVLEVAAARYAWLDTSPDSRFQHIALEVHGAEQSNEWLEPVDDAAYAAATK